MTFAHRPFHPKGYRKVSGSIHEYLGRVMAQSLAGRSPPLAEHLQHFQQATAAVDRRAGRATRHKRQQPGPTRRFRFQRLLRALSCQVGDERRPPPSTGSLRCAAVVECSFDSSPGRSQSLGVGGRQRPRIGAKLDRERIR